MLLDEKPKYSFSEKIRIERWGFNIILGHNKGHVNILLKMIRKGMLASLKRLKAH